MNPNQQSGQQLGQQPNQQQDQQLASRLLDTIEKDILPLTERGVAAGNKIFGAALLHKHDLSTFLAETNNELENPLWHGEMHLLKRYYELPADNRPEPSELIFLSTHEPCSLCLSAITWTGFDNFYYFFSHQDSKDAFAIPHDLKILKEVFDVEPGGYRRSNEFWTCRSVQEVVSNTPNAEAFEPLINSINKRYDDLSETYQQGKATNNIPLD
jgi:tRNA(Arg) A34 adenosine deaminase TadA